MKLWLVSNQHIVAKVMNYHSFTWIALNAESNRILIFWLDSTLSEWRKRFSLLASSSEQSSWGSPHSKKSWIDFRNCKSGGGPWLTASKKMETFFLQPQYNEFCQQPEEAWKWVIPWSKLWWGYGPGWDLDRSAVRCQSRGPAKLHLNYWGTEIMRE